MTTSTRYTIEQIKTIDQLERDPEFILEVGEFCNELYGGLYDWKQMKASALLQSRFMICYRDNAPVGLMVSRLSKSFFDPEIKVLKQILLYGRPGTRAAYLLMQDFIDFGRANADHILTMIGSETNVKRQSLEKLGFQKVEELYRIEVGS